MSELFAQLGIDPKLLFAQAVNFLLVLWFLNRFVFTKVLRFLEERKQGIQKGVELTAKAEREMERIGEARKLAMAKAREVAQGMMAEAKAKGAATGKEIVNEARQGAGAILQTAKEEAERKKQDALRETQQEMQRRAFFLAEKVLARTLTKEDEKRMGQELANALSKYGKES